MNKFSYPRVYKQIQILSFFLSVAISNKHSFHLEIKMDASRMPVSFFRNKHAPIVVVLACYKKATGNHSTISPSYAQKFTENKGKYRDSWSPMCWRYMALKNTVVFPRWIFSNSKHILFIHRGFFSGINKALFRMVYHQYFLHKVFH